MGKLKEIYVEAVEVAKRSNERWDTLPDNEKRRIIDKVSESIIDREWRKEEHRRKTTGK